MCVQHGVMQTGSAGMQAAQLRWQGKPQRNPLILSAQMPGSRPGSVCVTMIKHQWLSRLAHACLCAYACMHAV